jgi:hypothetical protein
MSYFTDFNELKRLKAEVRKIHRQRKSGKSERERFLETDVPPKLLTPNPHQDDLFYIGGHFIPVSKMRGSILTQGVSSSGKTLQLKPQIASAIKATRRGSDRRVIIADAKQDMLPFVAQLTGELGIPFLYFNVSDRRSIAYDIARDIGGRSDKCGEAARQLIPTPRHGEPFWSQAAQALLQAGMLRLNQTKGVNWGLHDLYSMALMAMPELVEFLSVHPSGKRIAAKYLPDDRGGNTQFGFTSQLDVSLRQLEVAASAQYYTPRSRWVSTGDFLDSESVLLIGTNTETRETTNPVVRLLFQNLVNRINSLPDSSTRKIFTFLDELPTWGFLPKIDELLAFSRSKGAVTSLVFQDIEQLNEIYGRSNAASITGNCQTKLLFTPASYDSAKWAVQTLGERPFRRFNYNKQFTYEGITESQSISVEKDFPLTTGELMDLGIADPSTGSRFIVNPLAGKPFLNYMTPQEIESFQPKNANIPLVVEREPHQYNMPTDFDPNQFKELLSGTFTNEALKTKFLSNYEDGSYEQELAKQMCEMFCEMSQRYAREFTQFYGNQQRNY